MIQRSWVVDIAGLIDPPFYPDARTRNDDVRLVHYLSQAPQERKPKICIVGFPVDEGVARNGGRVGARGAPAKIREQLARLTVDARIHPEMTSVCESLVDLGDVLPGNSLEESQERLGRVVGSLLSQGITPIILGGGHETAYGHFRGYESSSESVSILNIDAHPDVRPLKDGAGHSGSPFRQAMESTSVSGDPGVAVERSVSYGVAGLLPQSVSKSQIDYLESQGCRYWWSSDVHSQMLSELFADRPQMISFDIDAVDQAFAPGVSAPATGGMDSRTWLAIALLAGKTESIQSMDIVELNPKYDVDGRTAKLAAMTAWSFIRGFCGRSQT